MTWMLSPALILACTSVELFVLGITMSVTGTEIGLNQKQTNKMRHHQDCVCTSSSDDALHHDPGFLQVVDWEGGVGPPHAGLPGHHGNRRGLNRLHAGHWLLIQPCRWSPADKNKD